MRTSAAARFDGRMNVDSDRFICRAMRLHGGGVELTAVFEHTQGIA